MYIIQRKHKDGALSYYTYDGWARTERGKPLDLSNCVRFTEREALKIFIKTGDTIQWYGSYK
jgi:hypothetical protein